jgi:hypothetical protein
MKALLKLRSGGAKTHRSAERIDGAEKTRFRPALAAYVYLPSWLPRLGHHCASGTFLLTSPIAPLARSAPQYVFARRFRRTT